MENGRVEMRITKLEITKGKDGVYEAFFRNGNKPCVGFSADRQEAISFCLELVEIAKCQK